MPGRPGLLPRPAEAAGGCGGASAPGAASASKNRSAASSPRLSCSEDQDGARAVIEAIRFATRINSFASNPRAYWPDLTAKPTILQMVERAATVRGLTDLDLNYPDHLAGSG